MALRTIIDGKDPVLRKKSRPVENFDQKLHTLLDDMIETMENVNGVGLAACQVGVLRRAIVIDAGEGIIELINPEIIESSGEQTDNEGCLSFAGWFGEVTRPNVVKIKAFDRYGKPFTMTGEGLLARAFCHETEHLEGVLFIDHAEEIFESKPEKG